MSKKLLLADDSITIQKVIGITFASEDVDLAISDNGDAALEMARAERPDLILADVLMPGKNGYELCEAIKKDPQFAAVPVLLLTGTFEPFDEDKARACGADAWIAKPFESQALIDKVQELLSLAPDQLVRPAGAAEPATQPAPEEPSPAEAVVPASGVAELEEEGGWGDFSFEEEDMAAEEALEKPEIDPATEADMAFALSEDEEDVLELEDADILEDELEMVDEEEARSEISGGPAEEPDFGEWMGAAQPEEEPGEMPEEESPGDAGGVPSELMVEEAEPEPMVEADALPESEADYTSPAAATFAQPEIEPAAPAAAAAPMRDEEIAAIVEKVAAEVVNRLAGSILERIAWEVVPDLAESMIQDEIRKIKDALK